MRMAPCTTFLQCYNACVCLYGRQGEVYSKWEGFTTFFLKMQAFNETIQVLPWQVKDHNKLYLPLAISSLKHSFFDLQTYMPCLASTEAGWTTRRELGHIRHPFLFLSSSISPENLVKKMGPWLQDTKQGLWPRQLPLTEQTKCLGWLLYSGPEYNLSTLRQQIEQESGSEVALRFRIISDGRPVHAGHTGTRTKAIHMEVDWNITPKKQQRLESLYSSTARTFPLGIKMRLIPELGTTANSTTYTHATQLINHQACFLAHTKTSRILQAVTEPCNLELAYQTLRDMILPSGLANRSDKPLFHAISAMVNKEGYLVRYLPQYSTQAQAAIAHLEDKFSKQPTDLAPPTPSTQNLPSIIAQPAAPSSLEKIDRWIGLRFCTPLCLGLISRMQPPGTCIPYCLCNITNQPSNHNILRWLTALWQLLQNTA